MSRRHAWLVFTAGGPARSRTLADDPAEWQHRLTALQDRISHEENQAQVGRTVQVLVAETEGRKDGSTHRVTGRAADNRLVHLAVPPATAAFLNGIAWNLLNLGIATWLLLAGRRMLRLRPA